MMKPRHRDFMSVYCYIAVGALLGIIVGLVVGLIFGHVGFSMLAGARTRYHDWSLSRELFPYTREKRRIAFMLSFFRLERFFLTVLENHLLKK